jgi:putative transcriptional regulator
MRFAAGQLPNALGLMLACHLQHCGPCQARAHRYEALGGELMQTLSPVAVGRDTLAHVLARLDEPAAPMSIVPEPSGIPRPIRRFVPADYDRLKWSGMTRSIREFTLPIPDPVHTAKFYRIAAGKELPVHTHRGNEFTLVMRGSFSDAAGDYHAGDFILADTLVTHQPRAWSDQDCICFAVMDAPLKMTGRFGRLLNPFLR